MRMHSQRTVHYEVTYFPESKGQESLKSVPASEKVGFRARQSAPSAEPIAEKSIPLSGPPRFLQLRKLALSTTLHLY